MTTPPSSAPFRFPVAARYAGMESSPLKDIFALAAREDVVSFAGGIPDPELFALEEVTACYDWVLSQQGHRALQYGVSEGELELREQAARRVSRDLPTDASQVRVTSGSQEGLFVVAQALLEPGDVVLVESPTYLAAVQAFSVHGARMIGVDTDDDGVIPEALEEAIRTHHPRMVYLIPTFQNPTGRTMPLERRQAVAEVLQRTHVPLIEDDPYGALSFTGSTWAPIAALPGMGERTILLNSMSKLMSPGVRIGWMRAEGPVLDTLAVAKAAISMQSSVVDQLMVARYLETVDLDAHVARVSAVYRERPGAAGRSARDPSRGRDVPVGRARRGLRRAGDARRRRRGRGRLSARLVLLRRPCGPLHDAAQLRHPLPRRDRGRRRPPRRGHRRAPRLSRRPGRHLGRRPTARPPTRGVAAHRAPARRAPDQWVRQRIADVPQQVEPRAGHGEGTTSRRPPGRSRSRAWARAGSSSMWWREAIMVSAS